MIKARSSCALAAGAHAGGGLALLVFIINALIDNALISLGARRRAAAASGETFSDLHATLRYSIGRGWGARESVC
jgi:hypothetical protein